MFCKECLKQMYNKLLPEEIMILALLYQQQKEAKKSTEEECSKIIIMGLSQQQIIKKIDEKYKIGLIRKALILLEAKSFVNKLILGKSNIIQLSENGFAILEIVKMNK